MRPLQTSISHENMIISKRELCSICGNRNISEIMDCPDLPLTGLFSDKIEMHPVPGIDQILLWCPECGHGQLYRQIDPFTLYDSNHYSFKTSLSPTARAGTQNFLNFLSTISRKALFDCVLDVGCNDLHLLAQMKEIGKIRVGIDPVWIGKDPENNDSSIKVIGGTVEDSDLKDVLPCRPDLIVCRHTLEHISNPCLVLEKLIACATDNALFLFEVPSFESLVRRMRFDQVYHEHLNYFSLSSFSFLFSKCGIELLDFSENYHDWGALIVAFRKQKGTPRKFAFPFSEKDILRKLELFTGQMKNTLLTLQELNGSLLYGYGAASMLPVLAYHIKSDLSFLQGIIDDDRQKEGLYYSNLPLRIRHSGAIANYAQATMFITAVDNVKPIMIKLLANRPKHIVYPFHIV